MLEAYNAHAAERAALGIPALPLTKDQTAELVKLFKNYCKYNYQYNTNYSDKCHFFAIFF